VQAPAAAQALVDVLNTRSPKNLSEKPKGEGLLSEE
jgi:hypothetical protein